jgi:pimeloyl-ACP methyl ester carboxylesterase
MRRFPLSLDSARLLAQRALHGEAGRQRWRIDPRLLWISPLRITEAQARELLAAIQCPTLVAVAPFGEEHMGDALQERLALMRNTRLERVEGTHHFHMDAVTQTARLIENFLSDHLEPRHAEP